MKIKLVVVLLFVAALFIGAVLWRADSFIYGDRLSWVEAQGRTQVTSMAKSIETELKSLQRIVSSFTIENLQNEKVNWNSLAPYYAVASFLVSGDRMEPQSLLIKDNSTAQSWDKNFVKTTLGRLEGFKADKKFYVKPFQDTAGRRHIAFVIVEKSKAFSIFGPAVLFQSLIDAQKGSAGSFSIVTDQGLTVGHSITEYVGSAMKDSPVFKDVLKSGSAFGVLNYKIADADYHGMYEIVPRSNLFILNSTPLSEMTRGRESLWWQILLLGTGLVSVGLAIAMQLMSKADKEIDRLSEQVENLKVETFERESVNIKKIIGIDPDVAYREKIQASMRVASAVAHEMSGPLASILGYSQVILSKEPSPEISQTMESILREARTARALLDKMMGFAGEVIEEPVSIKVEGPLLRALKELEPLMSQKGVKVRHHIQTTSDLNLHVEALVRALTNILNNSVEAMERMLNKEIRIELFEDSAGVHLEIQDSGEGIEEQYLNKVVDPFFTTRAFQNHVGLGLSVALGILKNQNAEMRIESQKGKGTKIFILFKKIENSNSQVAALAPKLRAEPIVIGAPVLAAVPDIEEEKDAEGESMPASPLDVNIDAMLDFPESGIPPVIEVPPIIASSSMSIPRPESPPAPPGPPAQLSPDKDEVNASEKKSPLAEKPQEVLVSQKIQASDAGLEQETPQVQNKQTVKKVSKLDSYQVEIRRPGKRV